MKNKTKSIFFTRLNKVDKLGHAGQMIRKIIFSGLSLHKCLELKRSTFKLISLKHSGQ